MPKATPLLSEVGSELAIAKHKCDETHLLVHLMAVANGAKPYHMLMKGQQTQLVSSFFAGNQLQCAWCQHVVGAASIRTEATLFLMASMIGDSNTRLCKGAIQAYRVESSAALLGLRRVTTLAFLHIFGNLAVAVLFVKSLVLYCTNKCFIRDNIELAWGDPIITPIMKRAEKIVFKL